MDMQEFVETMRTTLDYSQIVKNQTENEPTSEAIFYLAALRSARLKPLDKGRYQNLTLDFINTRLDKTLDQLSTSEIEGLFDLMQDLGIVNKEI